MKGNTADNRPISGIRVAGPDAPLEVPTGQYSSVPVTPPAPGEHELTCQVLHT